MGQPITSLAPVEGAAAIAAAPDGEPVVCRGYEIPAHATDVDLLAHLRRLSTVTHPNLVPVLGAELRDGRLWVYSEYDGGRSLAELLEGSSLSPPAAVAVGLSVLAGLQALQRAGLAHGALSPATVQVASYGQVRLAEYGLRPRLLRGDQAAWGDPRRDVTAAGEVLCAALGVDSRRPEAERAEIERALPALAATALTIASGSAGRSASTALMMLSDGAGRLAARSRIYLSIAELARLAGGGGSAIAAAVDSVMPPPAKPEPVVARPLARQRPSRPARKPPLVPLLAGAGALFMTLSVVGPLSLAGWHRSAPPRIQKASPVRPAARPAPSASANSTPAAGTNLASAGAAAVPPAPSPAGAATSADAPEAAVAGFYQTVLQHRFDEAVAYWSDRMKADYPPSVNIDDRFAGTTVLTINQSRLVNSGGSTATVFVDLTEVTYGTTHHWVGTWQLVRTTAGWLLDQPNFAPA